MLLQVIEHFVEGTALLLVKGKDYLKFLIRWVVRQNLVGNARSRQSW